MEKVTGIGGIFFRAKDPKGLRKWYEDHLGVDDIDGFWDQPAGQTVFQPFREDTAYFGRREQAFMINFRVRDLTAMASQLRTAGIELAAEADWEEIEGIGRFARLHDPEGNPIELWEPAT